MTLGIIRGMSARDYHADPCDTPSLSSGIARTILGKSLAHAYAEHPKLGASSRKTATASMDRGSLVHALIAGTSADEIAVEDFTTFRSKAAQDWADECRRSGKVPALQCDMDEARPIAEALREKAARGVTRDPFADGIHEASCFWQYRGAWMRSRCDLLDMAANEPATIWDWKTIDDVSVGSVKRAMRRYRYDLQAAHYLAGMDAILPQYRGQHSFVFVFVETSAPYSVRRYTLASDTLQCAAMDINRAHEAWVKALASDEWPDATRDRTFTVDLPTYDDETDQAEIVIGGAA